MVSNFYIWYFLFTNNYFSTNLDGSSYGSSSSSASRSSDCALLYYKKNEDKISTRTRINYPWQPCNTVLPTYRNPSSGFVSGSSWAGFQSPESTQRFIWYLASFSPNFRITSCSIPVSCSSKHLLGDKNDLITNWAFYT